MPFAQSLNALERRDEFIDRHIGPGAAELSAELSAMLAAVGVASLEELIDQTVPAAIRLPADLPLPAPRREHEALADLKAIAGRNVSNKSCIGMGYYGALTPAVILRNVLENPGWYTAYTPYQAEIAQGRLEALMNFQQMVIDLTGLEIANASLLDEATAAAEAMTMARRVSKSASNRFLIDATCLPQTIDVIRTRAAYFGFEIVVAAAASRKDEAFFGALLQYPGEDGEVRDLSQIVTSLRANGATVAVASDLMALLLLKSPGAMGADIALGSSQRFGIPLGFGGPHAAFFATRTAFVRSMPGRIIGLSKDARGKTAYRMTLQTREQHIRREKANSNICTSQVLLANMAGLYAVYHGPAGLRAIAGRIHRLTAILAVGLKRAGIKVLTRHFFDTVQVDLGDRAETVYRDALTAGYNLRRVAPDRLGIACDETTTRRDVATLFKLIAQATLDLEAIDTLIAGADPILPNALIRRDAVLQHPVFNSHHTEHAMLRYLKSLQNRDLALDHSMIPLGSCTMKLNPTSAMIPITWPEFANIHPFAPREQTAGYHEMIAGLGEWLKTITGFDAVCMQPNSGAQGEYAGLVTIARYHASRGETRRNVCLIPKSAHGTNPATAQMANMRVVTVECDDNGNVDVADLKAKAEAHKDELACLMITYPSTHGVFEEAARDICAIVHANGGQVYMDGANLNAQVGLTSPGFIGADVSHMNLHKTFAIPHGGGGPGMGPIGLKAHLAPFMPNHAVAPGDGPHAGQGAVSAAPYGSASILPISWMYLAMLGGKGVKKATQVAILNANYIAAQLGAHYLVLYAGKNGRVAHECILDIRPLKAAAGISEIDIAKRLMDYGFHAPTVSFPVAGTIMVEPTESESSTELDRFIAALIAIREEIRQIENGAWPADDNPLKNAPHTQADVMDAAWSHPYSRQQAVFPLPWVAANKFWPSVNRIDDVYGDRNLNCVCPPAETDAG
ncbi:MAG: aminomethyl-transferring glycine dehydrogenase [Betaproteobacteria bacterium]|nr:aminomethyl-transferring glycine dehydrogenase [Betaproteobacteria bacterium]MCL2885268.1 aminomethyl-transferring glycine dehydrogenase [Betaproteobacteria bacterium]